MFSNYLIIGSFLIINCATATRRRFVLDVDNVRQPFVIEKELVLENQDEKYSLTAVIPNTTNNMNLVFTAKQDMMILACPRPEFLPEYHYALFENLHSRLTCHSNDFRPAVKLKINNNRFINAYSVGYWVFWITNGIGNYSEKPEFVRIFDIISDKNKKLLYTLHTILPGPLRALDSDRNKKHLRFKSEFEINEQYSNEDEVQLVPTDDLLPLPWKITTFYDFNYFTANERLNADLQTLNIFLRNYVNKTKIPLTIYSGVQDRAWYWKVVETVKKGILLVIINTLVESYEEPCTSQCEEYGLKTLDEQITKFYCCPLFERVAMKLKLYASKKDPSIVYLRFTEVYRFSDKPTSGESSGSSGSGEKHSMFNYE